MTALAGWENFYVIVGSSAGALIGLQFVVLTLIAERPVSSGSEMAGSAFGTPTVVHFGAVLLLAGILSAPWPEVMYAAMVWGVIGFIGVVYELLVFRRMRQQQAYKPVFEDWLFHLVLPLAAYVGLAVAAILSGAHLQGALFGNAASAMLLLFVGIHNAWDAVMYHVYTSRAKDKGRDM